MSRRSQNKETQKEKLAFSVPVIADERIVARSDEDQVTISDGDSHSAQDGLSHQAFLAERARYVDARQRAQQRIDQLVTTGSGGALVLSITFMHEIANTPTKETAWMLFLAWVFLSIALGGTLIHHHLSQRAFEDYISELDRAYSAGDACNPRSRASIWGERLTVCSSAALVLGVMFLAAFAFLNLNFT